MRVVVTGATGFIGRYVVDLLCRQGNSCIVMGRNKPRVGDDKVEFLETDLLDPAGLRRSLEKIEATHLIHLAWYAEPGKYWTSPLNLRWVEATLRLVENFCALGGQHVSIAGTCAEYDWSAGFCHEATTHLEPSSLYGTAKDAARRLTRSLCEQMEVPVAWGRIFQPYGVGESPARLVPSLVEVFKGHKQPFGVNLDQVRDFVHASDVAEAFLVMARANANGTMNIATGNPCRIATVVDTLAEILGADPGPVRRLASTRATDAQVVIGDNERLFALGWRPRISLRDGLSQFLDAAD